MIDFFSGCFIFGLALSNHSSRPSLRIDSHGCVGCRVLKVHLTRFTLIGSAWTDWDCSLECDFSVVLSRASGSLITEIWDLSDSYSKRRRDRLEQEQLNRCFF